MSKIRFISEKILNPEEFMGEVWNGKNFLAKISISKKSGIWLVEFIGKSNTTEFEELKSVMPELINDVKWTIVVEHYYDLFVSLAEQKAINETIFFKYKTFQFGGNFYAMKEEVDGEKKIKAEIEKWMYSIIDDICKKLEVDRICPIYEEEDRQVKLQIGSIKINKKGIVDKVENSIFWTETLFHSYLNHSSIVIYNSIKEMLKDCECVMVKQESYRHSFYRCNSIAIKNQQGEWVLPYEVIQNNKENKSEQ